MTPKPFKTRAEIIEGRRVLLAREDLAPYDMEERLGILAAEAASHAEHIQTLLNANIDTRDSLEDYVRVMRRRSQEYEMESATIRKGRP